MGGVLSLNENVNNLARHVHSPYWLWTLEAEGTFYVGFVLSNMKNMLFTKICLCFPHGIHFQLNVGKSNAIAFASLSSQIRDYLLPLQMQLLAHNHRAIFMFLITKPFWRDNTAGSNAITSKTCVLGEAPTHFL